VGETPAWEKTSQEGETVIISYPLASLPAEKFVARTDHPIISMRLVSDSEHVLLVRETLVGVARALDLDAGDLEDMLTAVTEACNNVVLHAYPTGRGILDFELYAKPDTLEVVIRDIGVGIQPRLRAPRPAMAGIGIPVIQSLAQRVEYRKPLGDSGTEVTMEFGIQATDALQALATGERPPVPPEREATRALASAEISIAPASLAASVLPRLFGVFAAQAHFSTSRVSDVHMLADALSAHAPSLLEVDRLSLVATVSARDLELRVGPLGADLADRMVRESEIDGPGSIIERLTDRRHMASAGSMEMLALELDDRS
jgi:serine/threonine-protein kinase RsbW